jgi:hypothetical protein
VKSAKGFRCSFPMPSSTSEYPLPNSFTGIERCQKHGPRLIMSITICTCLGLSSGIIIPFAMRENHLRSLDWMF